MIPKAPIITNWDIAEALPGRAPATATEEQRLVIQRDADHQYYLKEFVKWLKVNGGKVANAYYSGNFKTVESLLKEGEDNG